MKRKFLLKTSGLMVLMLLMTMMSCRKSYQIAGRVYDPNTGKPWENAIVKVRINGTGDLELITNFEGAYVYNFKDKKPDYFGAELDKGSLFDIGPEIFIYNPTYKNVIASQPTTQMDFAAARMKNVQIRIKDSTAAWPKNYESLQMTYYNDYQNKNNRASSLKKTMTATDSVVTLFRPLQYGMNYFTGFVRSSNGKLYPFKDSLDVKEPINLNQIITIFY